MRVSLESSGPSTSLKGSAAMPTLGAQVAVIRQSRSGTLPAFCSERGGTP